LVIASSRRLEQTNPQLALKLYPLNADAMVAWGVEALGKGDGNGQFKTIEQDVRAAIPFNAGDARIYSLLGEIMRRSGQDNAAYALFDHALLLAKTEIHALQWAIERDIGKQNYRKATDQLDVLFRRWPDRIEPLAPALPAIYSSPDAYAMLLARLGDDPPWRRRLINALSAGSTNGPVFAARLIRDLAVTRMPPTRPETARVLSSLLRHKQYDLAYRTFLLTLAHEEKDLSGFVFDGAFRQEPSGRVFDWSIRQQPGTTLTLPAGGDLSQSGEGLALEFNETPVLRVGIEQYLMLPPGDYEIAFKASAFAAKLPKGLTWSLDCRDPGKTILRLDVPPGDYKERLVSAAFSVPHNCPIQVLSLSTNAIAESWSERYSGRVLFQNIRISTVQS
jgi:hypothetical protein